MIIYMNGYSMHHYLTPQSTYYITTCDVFYITTYIHTPLLIQLLFITYHALHLTIYPVSLYNTYNVHHHCATPRVFTPPHHLTPPGVVREPMVASFDHSSVINRTLTSCLLNKYDNHRL